MELTLKRACLFGDSIAKGIVLDDYSGKYEILKNNFAELAADSLGVLLSNKAKFGCTIKKGQEVITRFILQSLPVDNNINLAFLEFGGNDCDFDWKEISLNPEAEHLPKTTLKDFVSTYEQIVEDLKSHGFTPVILTLPPLVADSYFKWISRDLDKKENILSWLGGRTEAIYYWHERYNSAVWEVATKTSCRIIDIRKIFLEQKQYRNFLCSDGIHLNAEGHKLVSRVLLNSADELGFQSLS